MLSYLLCNLERIPEAVHARSTPCVRAGDGAAAQSVPLILYVSLRLPSVTWTFCLENENNELFICRLSVFETRKSLKTFYILK